MSQRTWILLGLTLVWSLPDAGAAEKFWNLERYWGGPRKPMIEVSYGQSVMQHKLFDAELPHLRTGSLKLGHFRANPKFPNIGELDDRFLFLDYTKDDLFGTASGSSPLGAELIRFGMGRREGYAYDFGSTYLYPYTQTAFCLTKLTTKRPAGLSEPDAAILDRFQGAFRFGSTGEVGMAFGMGDLVSIRAGYENWVIHPRWVFWPWLGSYIIGSIGMELISNFGDDIVEGTPTLGPLIYTILRGALIYSATLVLRDAQYWPFRSEKPMTGEGFRVGMTFTF